MAERNEHNAESGGHMVLPFATEAL